MMKKKLLSALLAGVMLSGMLSGCGGGDSNGSGGETAEEGKVVNIYVWNNEFQRKFNAYYPSVSKTSNDLSVTYLEDGTEVHWIINPNQDGVYQQKLDEALIKQSSASADEKVDLFLAEADYIMKYTDPDVGAAAPISSLGITDADIANQYPSGGDRRGRRDPRPELSGNAGHVRIPPLDRAGGAWHGRPGYRKRSGFRLGQV